MASSSLGDLGRNLKKQIEQSAQRELNERACKGQSAFDRVFNAYQGQPVETIVPHLRSAFRRAGIALDSRELREMARHVTDSERVSFSAARARL